MFSWRNKKNIRTHWLKKSALFGVVICCLLQIDKKDDKHFHAYLDLPSTTRELESPDVTGSGKFSNSVVGGTHSKIPKIPFFSGPYSLSFKDSFKISTFVCSTKLTHNGMYLIL